MVLERLGIATYYGYNFCGLYVTKYMNAILVHQKYLVISYTSVHAQYKLYV